jgi:Glycine zipper
MKGLLLRFGTLALVMAFLAGCGETRMERGLTGGGIGAAGGAGVGALTGLGVGRGALIGGGIGAATGALTDREDIDLGDAPF